MKKSASDIRKERFAYEIENSGLKKVRYFRKGWR